MQGTQPLCATSVRKPLSDIRNTKHPQDIDVLYAGVIYLSENTDIHSGTCLYEKENDGYKLIHEFENVYNKMIMYDASIPHGTTKFVDDRLSIVFFVKELSVIN